MHGKALWTEWGEADSHPAEGSDLVRAYDSDEGGGTARRPKSSLTILKFFSSSVHKRLHPVRVCVRSVYMAGVVSCSVRLCGVRAVRMVCANVFTLE